MSATGLAALSSPLRADHPAAGVSAAPNDLCIAGGEHSALFIPGNRGLFGRLSTNGETLTLRAQQVRPSAAAPWPLAYVAQHRSKSYGNPTLLLRQGERVRIELVNALPEPTIAHWHGLAVDSRNDGAGSILAAPGGRFSYDFEVRDRAGLYWYHPHPHGLTAGQAYGGLFGMIEVEDDDERALRAALDLVPGATEFPLVLQDRRPGSVYGASEGDAMHGFVGNRILVNGSPCPFLDVATRVYRFRVLNASNARTYRLGLRTAAGKALPLLVIGTDGGLLATPREASDVFLSTAERVDVLVDLSGAAIGESVLLETRSFDPMHMEMTAGDTPAAATDHAAMGHAMPPPSPQAGAAPSAATPHAGHGGDDAGGDALPEGAPALLLELRVRQRAATNRPIPARLSTPPAIDATAAPERALRLGFAKARWRINDRVFAMGEAPIEVKRNTVETWLIRNYFNSMPHAMHLHGFHFQVLERQTSPEQIAALKIDARGRLATDLGMKDTVLVWPGESVRVAIDFAMPFAGEQTYMFHCHNLEHEDGGMMLGVKVA